MSVSTKILKPTFSDLKELGYLSIIYTDDSYLNKKTFEKCLKSFKKSLGVLSVIYYYFQTYTRINIFRTCTYRKSMTHTLTNQRKEK